MAGSGLCGGSSALQWYDMALTLFFGNENGSRICKSGLCTPFIPAISAMRWSISNSKLETMSSG